MDGKIVDQEETPFGIRTVGFDATNGFLLNGKHYEIYGTCNHQDAAGVGAAIPDALQEFRVKQLKAFGCNAIRTSHNPPTPELLDVCDRLGMLVLDESRLMGSDSGNMKKWDDQIRRDRNHPSVAMWCVANEQFAVQDSPQAGNVARTMQDYVKQLDPTRPVTYASPEGDVYRGINSVIEVRGWNYHYGSDMDRYHAEHPNPAKHRHRAGQRRRHARHLRERSPARLRRRLRRRLAGLDHHRRKLVEFLRRPPLALRCVRLDRLRLSRRADAILVAVHQLAFRHSRHVRFSKGRFLLLQIVVDHQHRAALAAALELAGQGRAGNPRRGVSAIANRWNFS